MVEYVDVEEQLQCMVAVSVRQVRFGGFCLKGLRLGFAYCTTYSHCEIHPSLVLGVCSSSIPFPGHNQSPRNVYQCAMGKQSIGLYCCNYLQRFDTNALVICYLQKPLSSTR